jgi:hypothetical protein
MSGVQHVSIPRELADELLAFLKTCEWGKVNDLIGKLVQNARPVELQGDPKPQSPGVDGPFTPEQLQALSRIASSPEQMERFRSGMLQAVQGGRFPQGNPKATSPKGPQHPAPGEAWDDDVDVTDPDDGRGVPDPRDAAG